MCAGRSLRVLLWQCASPPQTAIYRWCISALANRIILAHRIRAVIAVKSVYRYCLPSLARSSNNILLHNEIWTFYWIFGECHLENVVLRYHRGARAGRITISTSTYIHFINNPNSGVDGIILPLLLFTCFEQQQQQQKNAREASSDTTYINKYIDNYIVSLDWLFIHGLNTY